MIETIVLDTQSAISNFSFSQTTLITGLIGTSLLNYGYYKFPLLATGSEGITSSLVDYPAATDVRTGIDFANGSITGNMTEPAEADVKQGTQYGANGTEFTGTYIGGGKKNFGFNF